MNHACGCRQGGAAACQGTGTSVAPGDSVEMAARRSPQAVEILRGFGVDTCCGGTLTLAQAAASAGVPVERLVRALEEAGEGR